jgi:hypothetical protein
MSDFNPWGVAVALKSLPSAEAAPGILGSLFTSKKTDAELAAEVLSPSLSSRLKSSSLSLSCLNRFPFSVI